MGIRTDRIKISASEVFKDLETIRKNSPLVHNITNYVVMNTTANALLAIGASPVMAHAESEVAEMTGIASSLVINIGTLSDSWIKSMLAAGRKAEEKNIPVVFDPVGAGATHFRTETSHKIINTVHPSIIRGNASEIMAMAEKSIKTKGVDSTSVSNEAIGAAKILNKKSDSVICISGKYDYIVCNKGNDLIKITNGDAMMQNVTGMGCTASALCGAFAAVNPQYEKAAAHAMTVMGIAGEIAGKESKGPGSFQANFLDTLYRLNEKDIRQYFLN